MHFDDVEGEELFRRRFLFVLSFFASDYFKDNFNGIIKEDWSITEDKPSYSASMFQKVGIAVYKCQWTENVSADASDGKFRLFLLSNDLQTKWATRYSVVELINLWRPLTLYTDVLLLRNVPVEHDLSIVLLVSEYP